MPKLLTYAGTILLALAVFFLVIKYVFFAIAWIFVLVCAALGLTLLIAGIMLGKKINEKLD